MGNLWAAPSSLHRSGCVNYRIEVLSIAIPVFRGPILIAEWHSMADFKHARCGAPAWGAQEFSSVFRCKARARARGLRQQRADASARVRPTHGRTRERKVCCGAVCGLREQSSASPLMINNDAEIGGQLLSELPSPRQSFGRSLYDATADGAARFLIASTESSLRASGRMVTEPLDSCGSISFRPSREPRAHRLTACVTFSAFVGGSLDRFCSHLLFRWEEKEPRLRIHWHDIWLTAFLTLTMFVFCTMCASLSSSNRHALKARADARFIGLLLVPATLDVMVTGLALLALAFTAPAIVGAAKSAVQLLVLSIVSRILVDKPFTMLRWLCLLVMLLGLALLATAAYLTHSADMSSVALGLLLACASGLLGAWRNLVESAILADEPFPSGALLLAESALSALTLGAIGLVTLAIVESSPALNRTEDGSLQRLCDTLARPGAVPVLLLFYVLTYTKDSAKLWLIKHASVLHAKAATLLYPFGTWATSLAFYYGMGWCKHPVEGQPWQMPSALIQLLGFVVIILGSACFVLLTTRASAQHA